MTKARDIGAFVRQQLAGCTPTAHPGVSLTAVSQGLTDPPSYLVQVVLLGIMQFPDLGREDKVSWQTAFTFKNHVFLVRDYKFGSWAIEASHVDTVGPIARELERRIRGAAGALDAALLDELRAEVKAERYWLMNSYPKLWPLYESYRRRTLSALRAIDAVVAEEATDISGAIAIWNRRREAEQVADHDAFGLLGAFFSLTEFLCEAMYALHREAGTLADFNKLRLDEQLKTLLPVATDRAWQSRYARVHRIKERYRNPLHHGLTDEETGVLVRIEDLGLVPTSYRYAKDRLHLGFDLGLSADQIREVIATCDEFIAALRTEDPFAYYFAFIASGLPIPVALDETKQLRAEMTDDHAWMAAIDARLEAQDRFDNREF